MKVVVLCGGMGTRLREETEFRPKPMVEIGGRPILWHIMKVYAHSGFREFVLCLGYRGNMIKDYFLNYEAMNNDFTISLGRKSRISYTGIHAEQGFEVTLAETGLDTMTGGRLRRVEMNGTGLVMKFLEKPRTETFASAGFFVFQREIFDYLDGDECMLEREPLQRLAAEGQLMAYGHEGFFYAMDTYREYEHLNDLWAKNHAPWKVW
jgi:glucose-1-phosphate cytidylyltransferase